jgi:NAD(P)-dependent dehydrogenase (short-subunit alcohol dehydrogenase family)
MSTPLGSLSLISDSGTHFAKMGLLAYSSSKSALNCATVLYANALRDDGVLIHAAWPDYVATDLNQNRGALTVEQGAELPVELAPLGADGPTGAVFTRGDDGTRKTVPGEGLTTGPLGDPAAWECERVNPGPSTLALDEVEASRG